MKTTANSKRTYKVVSTENNLNQMDAITLTDLLLSNDDSELFYAMTEVIDEILDLNIGESLYFQPNRDRKNSEGLILRIK